MKNQISQPLSTKDQMDIEQEIDGLKSKLSSLDKRRQWYIAVASALIAAFASIFSAFFSYQSTKNQSIVEEQIARDKHVIDIFSEFGQYIVKGSKEEKCTTLLLIGSIQPTYEIKERTKELSRQVECIGVEEALTASEGKICGERVRITMTTERRLSGQELSTAKEMCVPGITVPEKYDGPWSDGTVSFYYGTTNGGSDVWCNCAVR